MALLSSSLLLTTYSLTSILLSFFLLFRPATLLSSPALWLLGESMQLRTAAFEPSLSTISNTSSSPLPQASSELLALLASVLAITSILQMTFAQGLSTNIEKQEGRKVDTRTLGWKVYKLRDYQVRWMFVAGTRIVTMGTLVAWIYIFHSARNLTSSLGISRATQSGFGLLANRITFSLAITDMLFWGYLWTVIGSEGRQVTEMLARKREEMEADGRRIEEEE